MFAQALCGIILTRVALRLLPLRKAHYLVNRCLRTAPPVKAARRASADQAIWAAVSAGRHSPLGTTCLATALVAQAMLRRNGHDAHLRIGVRRDGNGTFAAHAWLEREDRVVLGGPVEVVATYTPLPEMEHLIA